MRLLLFPLFCYLQASITALLQNIAVRKGHQLTLECTVNDSGAQFVGWFHFKVNTSNEIQMYTPQSNLSGEYRTRATIEMTKNSSILTIDRVQLNDSGLYGCKNLINSSTSQKMAHAIVLDGKPRIFQKNMSHIACEIDYNGNWAPELKLLGSETHVQIKSGQNYILSVDQSNGHRKVIVFKEISSFDSNITTVYSCQLSFNQRNLSFEHTVANIPTYEERVTCKTNVYNNSCYSDPFTQSPTQKHGGNSSANENILVISLATISFVIFGLLVAVIVISIKNRRRGRKSGMSKDGSTSIPDPDILDGSEDRPSLNGFTRRLPDIPYEGDDYVEILTDDSSVDVVYSNPAAKKKGYIAPDGTEYMLMNELRREGGHSPFRPGPPPVPSASAFPSMLYASIDHLQTPVRNQP